MKSKTDAERRSVPYVQVTAIWFNHKANSCNTDAMNIRINYGTAIKTPEWDNLVATPNSPVAYSIKDIGKSIITIKVKFKSINKKITKAYVKAEGGGILGNIESTEVNFSGCESNPEYVKIQLKSSKIAENGVLKKEITWNWEFSVDNKKWSPMGKTTHIIYVVLQKPNLPWKQDNFPKNTQLPWAVALEKSCEWAKGLKDLDSVAKKITEVINGKIGLKYDVVSGASKYSNGMVGKQEAFKCTDFLVYGEGKTVNCSDCATIFTTFANILGCNFAEGVMGYDFKLNKIIGIGSTSWGPPFDHKKQAEKIARDNGLVAKSTETESGFYRNGKQILGNNGVPVKIKKEDQYSFSYHEVPWIAPYNDNGLVYDACLKVDESDKRYDKSASDSKRKAVLPVKMKFEEYKKMLCTKGTDGEDKCNAKGNSRRPVF